MLRFDKATYLLFLFKKVFTHKISSWDEIIPASGEVSLTV